MNTTVKSLNTHEMMVALSAHISEAILHIHYENVDQRNHKSLNALVHALEDSAYHDIAKLLEEQKDHILVNNPVAAIKMNDFINEHSAAVYSSIYYKGMRNEQAIEQVTKDYPKAKEENITTYHKQLK